MISPPEELSHANSHVLLNDLLKELTKVLVVDSLVVVIQQVILHARVRVRVRAAGTCERVNTPKRHPRAARIPCGTGVKARKQADVLDSALQNKRNSSGMGRERGMRGSRSDSGCGAK